MPRGRTDSHDDVAACMGRYDTYRLVEWLGDRLSDEAAFRVAQKAADLGWRWARAQRRAVEDNLSVVVGGRIPERSRRGREVFRHFARYLVEFFSAHRVDDPLITIEGFDHLVEAQRRGRGTIVLTAHLGNWEVGAIALHRMGFPVSAVALPHGEARTDRVFNRQRERCGIRVIPLGAAAARQSLQSLREGRVLGLLGDQEFGDQGLPIAFCGGQLMLPRGPALLSLRGEAPAVPIFLIREGLWRFRLCIERPIWPEGDSEKDAAIRRLTAAYAAVMERYVKRFPEQWIMFRPVFASGTEAGSVAQTTQNTATAQMPRP